MPVSCCGANNLLNTACCQPPPEDTTAASIAKVKKVYLNMTENDVETRDSRIPQITQDFSVGIWTPDLGSPESLRHLKLI